MPFKSQKQRAKFYALEKEGKISKDTVEKWESETPKDKKLPVRATKKSHSLLVSERKPRRTAK
jgi:hypothetical protein